MNNRRNQSLLDAIFNLLKITPVWVGPLLSVAVFALVRWGLPLALTPQAGKPDVTVVLRQMLPMLSWICAAAVFTAWVMAEIYKWRNRLLLDTQESADSIRALSWEEFERLVCEAYRRQGYIAEVVGSATGDGGVDIELTGNGELIVVQCKHWRAFKVGVSPVRELLGVVVSRSAKKGILVTSGLFTRDAEEFAKSNSQLSLVGRTQLLEMIRDVQQRPDKSASEVTPAIPTEAPSCPACGERMVLRTARKGANSGSQFWGCKKFPACRGTRTHSAA